MLIQAKQNAIAKVAYLIGDKNTRFTIDDVPKIQKGIEICNLELGLATSIQKLQGDKNNPLQLQHTVLNVNFLESKEKD
jgi:hypothetical protein